MSDNWTTEATDIYVPTTGAVENRLSEFITDDDVTDKFVTGDMQDKGTWDDEVTDDDHIPTTDAVVKRHDTWYSDDKLDPNIYIQPGKFWVNTETQRLAYWNNSNPEAGYWVHVAAMPANDAPPVYVSDQEPTGSFIEEGDLWWNKADGNLYVRYCPDPSGSCQWVDASASPTVDPDYSIIEDFIEQYVDANAVGQILTEDGITVSPSDGKGVVTLGLDLDYIENNIESGPDLTDELDQIKEDIDKLEDDLAQEITDREEGDQNLQGNIDGLSGQLTQEIADREEGDQNLQDQIDGLITEDNLDDYVTKVEFEADQKRQDDEISNLYDEIHRLEDIIIDLADRLDQLEDDVNNVTTIDGGYPNAQGIYDEPDTDGGSADPASQTDTSIDGGSATGFF